ncbi:hypothetical protein [Saccharothrix deserti]|uniref:hypothetical protein n=1 Tax=Saccharothrix deserti TaxID=2593674 RepID=UPI00131ACD24|nr:hypothetical protein [Saccharothrix deserti]
MTTATATEIEQGAPVDASALSQYYTDLLSWPTTIDPSTGEVRLRLGDTVDALIMRAGFGGEVNHQLVRSMLSAPIIVVPGKPDDWIFLTQPRTTMRESTIADLVSLQVGWKEVGSTIVLPAFGSAEDELRWLAQPKADLELPPWGAVVGAVRRTASSRAW